MSYLSSKERIKSFIDGKVFPILNKQDLSYYDLVTAICGELSVTKKAVEEVILSYFATGKLKEERVITLPDEKVADWLSSLRKDEVVAKEAIKEIDAVVNELEDEDGRK